ncbi:MAG: C39 family peptidase [Oscillospiraceae bacterium]|nr:C39 family peptidase [Oscillospiraceae bacterium]
MEVTITSNAKLEIESSGDYKKDAKKACRFAYEVWSEQLKLAKLITTMQNRMVREGLYKPFEDFEEKQEEFVLKLPGQLEAEREAARDKKINKNFQRFIEASKKIKEAEAAGEDLPESVFKKWTPEDEREERKAEWESKQLEKLTAIMSEEVMRIGEVPKEKDSDSKFEHIFKKIEKGITEEKMEQYRKFCENSKETPKFEVKQTTPPQTKKEPVAPSTDFTQKALLSKTSESATTKTPIAPSTDFSKEKKSPPETSQPIATKTPIAPSTDFTPKTAQPVATKTPKKDVNLLESVANVVSSRVEPVINAVNNVVEMITRGNDEPEKVEKVEVETNVEFIGAYKSIDENIIQETDTWCGMASTLMVLTALETSEPDSLKDDYVRPTQSEIADKVRGWDDTGWVYLIRNFLNSQLNHDSPQYKYEGVPWDDVRTGELSESEVNDKIINSLAQNRPVILHSKPYGSLNYYSGIESHTKINPETAQHYIVVEAYDKNSETFVICDPTNIRHGDLSPYNGRKYGVTLEEIYKSVLSNGWLIYA